MKKNQMKKVYPLLELFSRLKEEDQAELLKHLNCEGCDGILECIHNALWNKDIEVGKRKLINTQLKDQHKTFRYLNKLEGDPKKRRSKLMQVGPGIGLIITAVLPILTEYVQK
jgi:DNA gyrase/topoisomerase IV subunit B